MNALVHLCINQHTKFEVPSFTNSKDMIGANFCKTDHVTLTTIRGVVYHHLIYSTCTQNLATLTSAVLFCRRAYQI